VQFIRTIAELTGEGNNLTNHQFSNGARVGEWRVEDDDTPLCGILEINLVGTDTKASDDKQVLCVLEDFGGKFGL
jgi:hypothetical protein